jgi:type VI secretion system secreted protein Hcp
MAEMFLMLDDIEGESLDETHADEIEILDLKWKFTHVVSPTMKDEDSSTKPTITDITIKKLCDKASMNLMRYCCLGKNIASGKITCRKNAGDEKVEYLIIDLSDIKVSDIAIDWEGHEGGIAETVMLNVAKFVATYSRQDNLGAQMGFIDFGFDIPNNRQTEAHTNETAWFRPK